MLRRLRPTRRTLATLLLILSLLWQGSVSAAIAPMQSAGMATPCAMHTAMAPMAMKMMASPGHAMMSAHCTCCAGGKCLCALACNGLSPLPASAMLSFVTSLLLPALPESASGFIAAELPHPLRPPIA